MGERLLCVPEVLGGLGLSSRSLERKGWDDTSHCKKCLPERMNEWTFYSFLQISTPLLNGVILTPGAPPRGLITHLPWSKPTRTENVLPILAAPPQLQL